MKGAALRVGDCVYRKGGRHLLKVVAVNAEDNSYQVYDATRIETMWLGRADLIGHVYCQQCGKQFPVADRHQLKCWSPPSAVQICATCFSAAVDDEMAFFEQNYRYTTTEAAAALGVTKRTMQRAIHVGTLAATRQGRDWFVSAAAIEDYRRDHLRRYGRKSKA